MRNLTIRVLTALITFTVGTTAASVWLFYPPRKSETPAAQDIQPRSRNKSDGMLPALPNPFTLETSPNVRHGFDTIGDTIGVVVLNELKYGEEDFVHFYNEDGSLWYKFTYYYDDSDGEFEYANDDFIPLSFRVDYFRLALRCVGKDNGRYEVIVNEETGLRKYVRADDRFLKLETWEEHLQDTAVDFNQAENPVLEAPHGRVKKVALPGSGAPFHSVHTVEVKGEWLKVKWDTSRGTVSQVPKYDYGWIKWKKGDKLLVEFFLGC